MPLDRWRRVPWDAITVVLAVALFPITLVVEEAVPTNPFASETTILGSVWLVVLVMGTVALLARWPRRAAVRSLSPYILYLLLAVLSLASTEDLNGGLGLLARLATPALVYLVAWSAAGHPTLRLRVQRFAAWWIAAAAGAFLLLGMAEVPPAVGFPERLTALGVVMLFPIATLLPTRASTTRLLGLVVIATAVGSGSRMASLAVIVVVLMSPSLGLSISKRTMLAAGVLLLFVAALQTQAFQDRWFTGGGTFGDLVGIEENVDTSGRREVWHALGAECRPSWLLGRGLGTANALSVAASPGFPQPHNEYLKVYCDNGVLGSLVFWAFFLAVGWRALRVVRVGHLSDEERGPAWAALQLLTGLFLLSITDNPLAATLQFMGPAAVIFAWSDRIHSGTRLLRRH